MDLIDEAIAGQGCLNNENNLLSCDTDETSKELIVEHFSSIAVFLVIICFEIIVCWRGFNFFRSVDFDLGSALVLSIGCEVLYMFVSSRTDKWLIPFRFILLSLSMTFLGYSTYKSDENLLDYFKNLSIEKEGIISELKINKDQLSRIEKDLKTLDEGMEVYVKHNLVTKGVNTLAPEKRRLSAEREAVKGSITQLKIQLDSLNSRRLKLGVGSTYNILTIKTYVTLATFFVFQVLICLLLPDVLRVAFQKRGK